jgi:hypothetical protein
MASSTSHARINDTKKRVYEEISSGGGMPWITKGREVENYVQPDKLEQAIATIYTNKYHSKGPRGDYQHALHFYPKTKGGKRASKLYADADKVKLARLVTNEELDTDVLDLRSQLADLVARIERANDREAIHLSK